MKSLPLILTAALGAALPAAAVTVLPLLDPNFEDSPNSAWTTFGNAYPDASIAAEFSGTVLDPSIDGAQQLKMFGNFTGGENFTGAFQDIAVDGTILKVGDLVQLTGFMALLSADPMTTAGTRASIEITFVDTDLLGEFGFGANKSADLTIASTTDTWLAASTPAPAVPVEAEFVRVKAVYIQDAGDFGGGAAWVDGLQLSIVPEPSSALLIGLSGLALLRRRRG